MNDVGLNNPADPADPADLASAQRAKPLPKWLPYVLFGCFVALNIVGFVTGGAAPKLIKSHPLLLVLGAPRYRWIVVVSPQVKAIPLIIISWLRLLLSDPLYYLIGYYYGDKALLFFESALGKNTMDSTRKLFDKATWLLSAFAAGPVICALAGLAKVNPKRFFSLDVAGTLIIAIALRLFAEQLTGPINRLVEFNNKNSKWLLIVTIVGAIVVITRFSIKAKGLAGEVSKFNENE